MKQYEFIRDTDENGKNTISVSDKPKKRLDLFPRLICLLLAFGIWLWIVNLNDTDVIKPIVLKIELEGQDALEDRDMMIYGLDKNEITVNIKGSNRDLRKYSEGDYRVVVDLSKIDEIGQHTLPLSVKTPQGSSLSAVDSEALNISFMIDFIAEKEVSFDILVNSLQESGQIKYSYENSIAEGDENTVLIKGPATFIDQISSARLNVDGSFASNSDEMVFVDFPLSFLDKNLNPILLENGVIDYSTEEIEVHVMAIAHKEVPVRIDIIGEGSDLIATPSIKAVEVWGAPSQVKQVNEYVITLPRAEIGKDAMHTTTSDLVDDGIYVTDGVQITISFTEIAG